MDKLNYREKQILDYITESVFEKGYFPSVREIKAGLDLHSTSTVHGALKRMEARGILLQEGGKSRTLRFGPNFPGQPRITARVPILGRVTAGMPILAVENLDGFVDFPDGGLQAANGELFALRISGTSMIEAGILDGDIVVVEKQESADNGDIVVALIDDEATVKTFYKENGHYRLQPENSTMEPIVVDSVEILGRVISSVRYYK